MALAAYNLHFGHENDVAQSPARHQRQPTRGQAMGAPPPRTQLNENLFNTPAARDLANFHFDFMPQTREQRAVPMPGPARASRPDSAGRNTAPQMLRRQSFDAMPPPQQPVMPVISPRDLTPPRQRGDATPPIPRGVVPPAYGLDRKQQPFFDFTRCEKRDSRTGTPPGTPPTRTPSITPPPTPRTPPEQMQLQRVTSENSTTSTSTPPRQQLQRGNTLTSNGTVSSGTPKSSNTTPKSRGIVGSERGHQDVVELMHNKDKLRQVALKPFKDLGQARLAFGQFGEALRDTLLQLDVSLPSDQQIQAIFEKHGHNGKGIAVEDFEALLFRLLCFMRAKEDVDVTPRRAAAAQQRDRRWRQEFIPMNNRQFADVYEILGKLGQGNFGTVHKVAYKYNFNEGSRTKKTKKVKTPKSGKAKDQDKIEDSKRQKRVCKVISKEMAQKSGLSLNKVREELAVLKHLDHPHTLRIFESFEDDGSFFLIMETALGGDLQEYMRHMEPTDAVTYERWVAKVMYQTLSALSYCHHRGVVHKDLKTENIMISTPKGTPLNDIHVVVVDFGLSEVFSSPYARSSVVSGTPPYMAPEVWTGNSTKACDLWSCGVMLFFLLSGRFPFHCQTPEEFAKATATDDPDWALMGGASKGAHELCKQLLMKSDVFRPSARQAIRHAWFEKQEVQIVKVTLSRAEIDSLLMVPKRPGFQSFLCRLVATQLDAGGMKRVNDFFHALDSSYHGIIPVNALARGLLALDITPEQADVIAKELDVAKRGSVSYTEFLAGFLDLSTKTVDQQDDILRLAWQQFSPEENGKVKANDVQNALAMRGMTVADLPAEFLKALNKDASGYLDFEWFKCLLLPGHDDLVPPAKEPDRKSMKKRPAWLDRLLGSAGK